MHKTNYNLSRDYWEQKSKKNYDFSGFELSNDDLGKYRLQKESQILINILIQNFNLKNRDLKILDMGCARGHFIEFFQRYGNVTGVDFSIGYVTYCRKRFSQNKKVKIIQGNILDFTSKDKYDLIFVGGVFMLLSDNDLDKAICQMKKMLKNNGCLILREATMSKYSIVTYKSEKEVPFFRRTVKEYANLFMRNHLHIKNVIPNYACTYTTMISKYQKYLPIQLSAFKNIVFEFIFLYIPIRLFYFIRKNMFSYHFFVVQVL